MKKIFYGIGFLVLSVLVLPTFAGSLETGVCEKSFSVPESCWEEVGTAVQKKTMAKQCNTTTGNLSDTELNKFILEVESFQKFLGDRKTKDETLIKIQKWTKPTGDATSKMENIQNLVEKYYAKHKIGNIICTFEKHGTDQKYGLCTKYAMEQFTNDIKDDCIEPSLTVTPSTRCRVEIHVKSNLLEQLKLEKQESKEKTQIELEKELGAKIGKTIELVSSGKNVFYFEVLGGDATDQKEKTGEILRDEDFLKKTDKIGDADVGYSTILENAKVDTKHCAVDVLSNMDIGGLRPRYLVGASDGTRNLSGSVHDLTYWFQRFGRKIVGFIAAIAVFFIVWNAFGLVTSMGDADKISSSKKAIQWILIGLALAIFSYVIIKTIISLTYLTTVDYVEPTSIGTEK